MAQPHGEADLVHPVQTRAAIYLWDHPTVSAAGGLDLQAQRSRCLAWATMQGWSIAAILVDTPAPARPALQQLRALVRDRQCEVVVIAALASLGPQVVEALAFLESLASAAVDLVSLHESFDTTSPHGSFALLVVRALARIALAPAVTTTPAAGAAPLSMPAAAPPEPRAPRRRPALPFGYVQSASGIAADPARAPVVRRIFMLRDAGATLPELVQLLRDQAGRGWNQQALAEVLAHEADYRGGEHPSGGRWPALLEER